MLLPNTPLNGGGGRCLETCRPSHCVEVYGEAVRTREWTLVVEFTPRRTGAAFELRAAPLIARLASKQRHAAGQQCHWLHASGALPSA